MHNFVKRRQYLHADVLDILQILKHNSRDFDESNFENVNLGEFSFDLPAVQIQLHSITICRRILRSFAEISIFAEMVLHIF